MLKIQQDYIAYSYNFSRQFPFAEEALMKEKFLSQRKLPETARCFSLAPVEWKNYPCLKL